VAKRALGWATSSLLALGLACSSGTEPASVLELSFVDDVDGGRTVSFQTTGQLVTLGPGERESIEPPATGGILVRVWASGGAELTRRTVEAGFDGGGLRYWIQVRMSATPPLGLCPGEIEAIGETGADTTIYLITGGIPLDAVC